MKYIDLRSDTVTQPTMAMREAMYHAVVGDDVYEDDPTTAELERLAAEMTGKEAALFVPSGTFGNQLALLTHTNRGDEVILEANCHIKKYEVGAPAVISGVQLTTVEGEWGKMPVEKIKKAIRDTTNIHFPPTTLICLENATGVGTVLDLDYMEQVEKLARENTLHIHLDGARLFNAAVSLGVDAKEICKHVDSVMFCLSKGLCSPVGSMLAGSKEFIRKARKNRKIMGGGLRQAGVLAACGLISLQVMTKRLQEDHDHAKYLAKRMEEIRGVNIYHERLAINMAFATFSPDLKLPDDFEKQLLDKGIKINGYRGDELRFVTHNDISKADIDFFVDSFKSIIGK